ncbi:biorientation of chromosomes in cell division protein 1-like 1 [Mercenaria mercenaria]|uniref:biorientation of chromosomes in cell division protein 1-like 1 n=1 Tax=Mercenaria mercenaria TaxID=6596 RepID=UPI00234E3D5C|nr:biorientation of chromosomes in cell division protein 1-like 1 [Mercenaria mercenaria]
MTAGSSEKKEADPELVEKIIHTLKSQGCFDQFRKEFIADADTKPAYHNLQQRVESYVSRFLSQQKWSPKLNKNQLRETLRRQINQSGMLNKGVERIVEQTINPKIMQLIKPKTDEVTCEHLNISLTEHKNALKRKQQEQQEKLMKSPDSASIQSLLSINFNSPPPGSNAPPFTNTSSPAMPPGQFNPGPPAAGMLGPTPTPAPSQFPPQLPGFSNTNPAGLTFPGISQQSFPFLPHGWNASLNAGFPPIFPGHPPFQTFSIPPPGTAMTVPPPAAGGLLLPPVSSAGVATSVAALNKLSPVKGIKGLNALLGLPTPSEEPAPPGTVILPDGTHIQKKRPHSSIHGGEDSKDGITYEGDNDVSLQSIPIPDSEKDLAERAVNEQIQKAMHEEMAAKGELEGDLGDQTGEGKRQYRFAWDEDIQEVDLEDSVGSSDISSVHTSDLSHFEDSENSSDSDLEDLENKLLQLEKKQKDEPVEEHIPEVPQETVEAQVEAMDTVNAAGEALTETAIDASPVKSQLLVSTDAQVTAGVALKKEVAGKPRKLLSLQYNYSDSDDEETREERKARIAKEKEDRYQRRLHRRAELEAKRKEREEERLRQKLEKLERAREAQGKAEKEKLEKEEAEKEKIEKEQAEKENVEKEKVEQEIVEEEKVEQVETKTAEVDVAEVDVAEKEQPVEKQETQTEKLVSESTEDKTTRADVEAPVESTEDSKAAVVGVDKETEVVTEVKEEKPADLNAEDVPRSEDEKVQIPDVTEDSETVVAMETDTVKTEINTEELEPATEVKDETKAEAVKEEKDTSVDPNISDAHAIVDTSLNTDSSATATESSVTLDTSVPEVPSSPDKKKHKRKTKAELKAELKEQKVMERKSRRQRIRNKRYMSDEFVYKGLPNTHLSESYDETMVIEETVEMVEIDSEQQTFEFDGSQVELVEIPLPEEGEGQPVTLETVEFTEIDIPEDGGEVLVAEGETYVVTDTAEGDPDIPLEEETVIEDAPQTEIVEVSMADTGSEAVGITTRSRSKITDDIRSNSSDQSDSRTETQSGQPDGKRKRKRTSSQSSTGEPVSKKQTSQTEGRQLRHKESRRPDSRTRSSYSTDDLYKPRHSFSRKSASSPPPLPSGPPPPPSEPEPSLPPLPPLPPPPAESPVGEKDNELPQAPESPDASDSDISSKGSIKDSRKRKRHSRSKSRSSKRSKRSGSKSDGSVSSSSRKRSGSYSSRSSYSRKRSKSSRSRSKSLSSISSESRSRSRSSRSYSRSRSRSRTSSGSRSVSRSRSRSISSVSSKRSAYSDDSEERRRKARPLDEVNFGEAAKRARQNIIMPPFGMRGPGPMGPRPPMVPMGPRGPMVPGPFPMRGMPPMIRGPRGMVRGRYPSPRHIGPDGSPLRPPVGSPGKPYYPPGRPMYMPQGPGWEDPLRPRPPYDEDDYYPPDDLHEGPGKTGVTERGTLYREDKSPTPPPERRPVYTPPPVYRERSMSPPIPTGITERGTLYREDTSPSPPPVYRRRIEATPSPPLMRPRHRMESISPSPPPMMRRRTRSARSGSYEAISPSPPHHPARRISVSPPPHPARRLSVSPPPMQRNTPPVLRRTRAQISGTPSPPSSGELTPSPPDLRDRSHSPVSPGPLGPVSPLSPRGPASPLDSLTPSPPDPRERLAPESPQASPRRSRRHRGREPASPSSSSEVASPPILRRGTRNSSSLEEDPVQYVTRETRSRHAKKSSKRPKR